jgi:putative hemolysin
LFIKSSILDYHSGLTSGLYCFNFLSINTAGTTVLLIATLFLLVLSFFLAGSEVAFFSLTSKDINILKTRKQPSYRRIVMLLEQPKTLLATMLIANSFINIGIILISNLLLHDWLKDYGLSPLLDFIIKVLSVTFLLVLFAEVLPKVWATHHKIWFASNASLIIDVFNSIFSRLSKRFVQFSDSIEQKVAYSKNAGLDNSNLDYAIDLLPEHEATVEEKQILKGIRKFGDTQVKQVMRTRLDVSGIESSLAFHEIIKISEDLHYSRLPVYRNNLDEVTGVLHMKDLLPYLDQPNDYQWHHLIRPPYFVHEQKLIEDLLQEFRSKRIHFAVVVDEFGGTSGIVTMEDILEEIIGEIKDEFDEEESLNKQLDEYNFVFEGKTMINDVCKLMNLPPNSFDAIKGESDSLAGLVLELAGEFPQVEEMLTYNQFTFVPMAISKNRIDKVKVTVTPDENTES